MFGLLPVEYYTGSPVQLLYNKYWNLIPCSRFWVIHDSYLVKFSNLGPYFGQKSANRFHIEQFGIRVVSFNFPAYVMKIGKETNTAMELISKNDGKQLTYIWLTSKLVNISSTNTFHSWSNIRVMISISFLTSLPVLAIPWTEIYLQVPSQGISGSDLCRKRRRFTFSQY